MTGSRLFIVFAIAVAGLVGGAGTLQKGTVPGQLCMFYTMLDLYISTIACIYVA